MRTLRLLVVLLAGLACAACPGSKRPASRVLLVGADGLEWHVLQPLLAQGKCPNLRALMERGAFGRLETMVPTLSPILWTTIATGKRPEQHGIHGFTDADLKQYTSSQRRVRALWNIADRCELASDVCGWWITWPVEELRGAMVSGSSSSALVEANWKPALIPGAPRQVWPAELEPEVLRIANEAGALDAVQRLARERVFGSFAEGELGAVEKKLMQQTYWSVQSDATYAAIAERLLREDPGDLNLVYFGGTDVVGHRFWRYYEPQAFHWPEDPELQAQLAKPEACERLARAIPNYYEWFDQMLGRLVAAAGADATVIVCSDHGFHAYSTDKPNPLFVTGHHLDGPPGVFIAAGPGIARFGDATRFVQQNELETAASILDIAPMVLALLGIPRGADMPGAAPAGLLDERARAAAALAPVPTHDTGFRASHEEDVPEEMRANYVERYKQLGYIGTEDGASPKPPR
ncbi:MAG: alkaline phosphatase family protein [Planctomycetes bacterium]|nr:alkaline phosphatase family protein [Planctomycetota bacterium]